MTVPRREQALWYGMIAMVAIAVWLPGVGNGFALDDIAVIVENSGIHAKETVWDRAFSPYYAGQLLRPVPLLGFALQWWIGGGDPLIFRLTSMVMYVGVCVLVFQFVMALGVRMRLAALGALLFAAHPVHSEVIANSVGQLELITALAVLLASVQFLRARRSGGWRRHDTVVIGICLLVATHSKEVGYVLPGLLVLLELFVIRGSTSWKVTWQELREPTLIVSALVVLALGVRYHFLGRVGGGEPHLGLEGFSLLDRCRTVLMLIPEWTRLLLWPVHLQVEYGPPALDPERPLGALHLLGLGLLALAVSVTAWGARRLPLLSVGFAWVAVCLLPVANLLYPTGVLLAERTLFLPSVGLVVSVLAVLQKNATATALHPARRYVATALAAVLVLAAALRSSRRQPDWHDTLRIVQTDAIGAPNTYRIQYMLGQELRNSGNLAAAEVAFAAAAGLYARDPRPLQDLAQLLRIRGACGDAVRLLNRALALDPSNDIARSRLIECLIMEQRWNEAGEVIAQGLAQGVGAYQNALTRVRAGREADSLAAMQPR